MSARSSTKTSACFLLLSALLGAGCREGHDKTGPQEAADILGAPKDEAKPLKVAAAADLVRAFTDVGKAYEDKTGKKVIFSFGSTGLLAKQIDEGAPFEVFAAANQSFADQVVKSGACFQEGQSIYARGRIVLWSKKTPAPFKSLADLKEARFAKVAIANPEHAPYGKAAKEALTASGVWDAISKKIVYGENIQQTLQFAQTGNADAAVVALSLALAIDNGTYVPIDPSLHQPLDQKLVVCKGSAKGATAPRAEATAFAAYVSSEDGRSIMKRYGFLLPGENLTHAAP